MENFLYKESKGNMKQNSIGEGGVIIFLVVITALVMGIISLYRNSIKPCGWFNEADRMRNEIPIRCLN